MENQSLKHLRRKIA